MRYTIPTIFALLLAAGCVSTPVNPEPQPTVTVTVTPSPEPSPTAKPSPEASPTPTPTPTVAPSPEPVPSPTPTLVPSPTPTQSGPTTTMALDTWERPEFAQDAQWKPTITRTLLGGQTTSVVLKSTDPCSLTAVPGLQKMIPVTLTRASAPSYKAGTYYDGLRPLTAANCADAKYLQLDVTGTVQVGDARITVIKKQTQAPALPSVPLVVEFNNWTMVRGYCNGGWCQTTPGVETFGKQGTQVLLDHRISPYKTLPSAAFSWSDYVQPFQLGATFIEWGGVPSYLASIPYQGKLNPWAYIMDEPKPYEMEELAKRLAAWKAAAPGVKRMVTTPIRHKDLDPSSPTFAKVIPHVSGVKGEIDLYVPVAEHICQETWSGSGDRYPCREEYTAAGVSVGGYVSNMSHGADGGGATGAPDLVIDRSAVEEFGFYLLALKFDLSMLLYYNSIEGWEKSKVVNGVETGRDVWTNPYQFGGDGDGLLMYPDRVARKALPSIRLKLIREASQWADTLRAAGMVARAQALMVHSLLFDHDLAKYQQLHAEAMAVLP